MPSPSEPKAEPVPEPTERRTLQIGLGLLLLSILLLLLPFWPWIVLSVWTAGLTSKLSVRLTRITGGRRWAAAVVTMGLLFAILIPIGAGLAVVLPDVIDLGQRALASNSSQGALKELVAHKQGGLTELDPEKAIEVVETHGQQALTVATRLASTLGAFALGVLIYFVGTYAALVHGHTAYVWLRERLPLGGRQVDRLRETFQETGRGLLFSVALTAAAQAGLATIAYVSLGVPRPLALGVATFFTSVIPAIGPFLVWGPLALGLLLAGQPIKAAILAGVCALIVAPADNVLRPLFAKLGRLQLHPFLVFFSMLGGIVTLGGWGLMLGPLLFRMTLEVLEMVRERGRAARPEPERVA